MSTFTLANMVFSKETHDSGRIVWDVTRNGQYFGQIWTQDVNGETLFHANVMSGKYDNFPTLTLAIRMMSLAAA